MHHNKDHTTTSFTTEKYNLTLKSDEILSVSSNNRDMHLNKDHTTTAFATEKYNLILKSDEILSVSSKKTARLR